MARSKDQGRKGKTPRNEGEGAAGSSQDRPRKSPRHSSSASSDADGEAEATLQASLVEQTVEQQPIPNSAAAPASSGQQKKGKTVSFSEPPDNHPPDDSSDEDGAHLPLRAPTEATAGSSSAHGLLSGFALAAYILLAH